MQTLFQGPVWLEVMQLLMNIRTRNYGRNFCWNIEMECIEKSKLSGGTKYGATHRESKHYFHGFGMPFDGGWGKRRPWECAGPAKNQRYVPPPMVRANSQVADRTIARCSCGLMPRTRLHAALNAKGIE